MQELMSECMPMLMISISPESPVDSLISFLLVRGGDRICMEYSLRAFVNLLCRSVPIAITSLDSF